MTSIGPRRNRLLSGHAQRNTASAARAIRVRDLDSDTSLVPGKSGNLALALQGFNHWHLPVSGRMPVPLLLRCAAVTLFASSCFAQAAHAQNVGQNLVAANGPAAVTAEQEAQRHTDISPELQGDLLMVRKRYLAALNAYNQAPQDSAVVWNKLGIANHHLLNLPEAKRDYEHALKLNPSYAEAMNNLGTIYYAEKDYKSAERSYRKALKLMPQSATAWSNLGTAYFAQRKYKKGAETYQKAFSIDPNVFVSDSVERIESGAATEDRASLNFCLAETFAQAGMHDRALEYLRHAFAEGFNNRKKLMEDKELATLRATPEFRQLLTQENIR